ncbi:MAG: DUF4097 family beta strand repeat protein [Bacilli bacterium]|nr:DUF4097 family beta strand repeat protein [Bacilli bacterium]
MKKSIIWIVITISVVLVAGVILSSLTIDKLEINEYEIKDSFKDIKILTNTADIEFALSDNSNALIVCEEQKNVIHQVNVIDNTLLIEIDDNRKWHEHIGINFSTPKITVYLPKNEYGKLWVKSNTGDINIPNNFKFASIDILADTGNITTYASVYENLRIKTGTGNVHVENINANKFDLSTTTGNLKVVNTKCKNLFSESDTGNIYLENVIASEKFIIETDTGDVKFKASDASDIFIETDTGNVTGSLVTDKVIFAESDTGNIDVPKIMAEEKCEIITDTGDIKITIE